jgi:hypothetical protein
VRGDVEGVDVEDGGTEPVRDTARGEFMGLPVSLRLESTRRPVGERSGSPERVRATAPVAVGPLLRTEKFLSPGVLTACRDTATPAVNEREGTVVHPREY